MSQPFDYSRYAWYDNQYGGPGEVQMSNKQPRPALQLPLREFVVHYGGAGTNWTDFGDTAAELRGIENYARGQKKPNEYNSAGDTAGETWEYSGRFMSAGNGIYNPTTWSHLCIYGLENLTPQEAQGLINSTRRARAQCVAAGYLTPDHAVRPHNHYKQTQCPGPLWTNKAWWAQIIAPLTPTAPLQPPITIGQGVIDVYYKLSPVGLRNSDTRLLGDTGLLPNKTYTFGLNPDIFPKNTTSVVANVTAVPIKAPGFVTIWESGSAVPNTSVVNFARIGEPAQGAWDIPVKDLKFNIRTNAQAHVIVDIAGFRTP